MRLSLNCGLLTCLTWICMASWNPHSVSAQAMPVEVIMDPAESSILKVLDEDTSFSFVDVPLSEALKYFSEQHQINLWLNLVALGDEGIDPQTTNVNIEVKGIRLRTGLKLLLDPVGLQAIVEDEVVKVTTKSFANRPETRVYPVADLARTPEELEQIQAAVKTLASFPNEGVGSHEISLIAVPAVKALVVRHAPSVQGEVLKLLRDLRTAQSIASRQTGTNPSAPGELSMK